VERGGGGDKNKLKNNKIKKFSQIKKKRKRERDR